MTARTQQARSHTPGVVPLPSELEVGQLWINTADRRIYTKTDTGEIIQLGLEDAPADGKMYVRQDEQWVTPHVLNDSALVSLRYTGAAGRTTFPLPAFYSDLEVVLNGLLLMPMVDYSVAALTSTVVLNAPLGSEYDVLRLISYLGTDMRDDQAFTKVAGKRNFSFVHNQQDLNVYLNGVMLDPVVDYSSDGQKVTLTSPVVRNEDRLFFITRS
jgi:hypothetical protein